MPENIEYILECLDTEKTQRTEAQLDALSRAFTASEIRDSICVYVADMLANKRNTFGHVQVLENLMDMLVYRTGFDAGCAAAIKERFTI